MYVACKVRENLTSYEDRDWHAPPKGTTARRATQSGLDEDGMLVA